MQGHSEPLEATTKKVRRHVTLSSDVDAELSSIAALTGIPHSKLVEQGLRLRFAEIAVYEKDSKKTK